MAERPRAAFIANTTPTSVEWVLNADQWIQTYYQFRDGKLYLCNNDNKDQHYEETEVDVDAFIREQATTGTSPYPDIIAFLGAATHRS